MSTAVDGLIKIGKTGSDNFSQRMTYLESNGYRNVSGLKRQFAIELSGYEEKERLLDSLFSRSRVSNTELFSLNINEVIQLLSSFEGKIVYPAQENKARIFENATEAVETALIPDGTYTLDVKQKDNRRVHAEMIVKKRQTDGEKRRKPWSRAQSYRGKLESRTKRFAGKRRRIPQRFFRHYPLDGFRRCTGAQF